MNSTFYEDIMSLMNEGKSSEDIASLMAEALNKAQEERNAEAIRAKKIDFMKRFSNLVNEYFETFEPGLLDGVEITEDECAEMLESLEELVKLVKDVKTVAVQEPKVKYTKADLNAPSMSKMFDDLWKEVNDVKTKVAVPVKAKAKPKTDDDVIKEFLDSILQ